ncbi:MAG: protein-tyrosine phosphatase family protein [Bellilinea sp.]
MTPDNPSSPQVPFPNAYWVIPGKLMAGEYPDELEQHQTRQKILRMLQLGINCFIDLTHPGDVSTSYHPILKEEAADLGIDVDIYEHRIEDFGVPQPLEMRAILDEIDRALATDKVVYVHCLAGLGRTGTVVGCYLVRHGEEGEAALQKLNDLRKATLKAHLPSPEHPRQEMMILGWRVGQ